MSSPSWRKTDSVAHHDSTTDQMAEHTMLQCPILKCRTDCCQLWLHDCQNNGTHSAARSNPSRRKTVWSDLAPLETKQQKTPCHNVPSRLHDSGCPNNGTHSEATPNPSRSRTRLWPTMTPLHTKLNDSERELGETGHFISQTEPLMQQVNRKKTCLCWQGKGSFADLMSSCFRFVWELGWSAW